MRHLTVSDPEPSQSSLPAAKEESPSHSAVTATLSPGSQPLDQALLVCSFALKHAQFQL